MTDDSAAMKRALATVWPQTRQLLCHFHVAQAEWRWLTSHVNNIPSTERQALMKGFRKVVCNGCSANTVSYTARGGTCTCQR